MGALFCPKIKRPLYIKKFKHYPIAYFPEGTLYLYAAINRTSKFACAELHSRQTKMIAAGFLRILIEVVPYKIHKILTDNGLQFTHHEHHKHAFTHIFERVCNEHTMEHQKTRVRHPWTHI
jgi:hypothetical protein